MGHAHPSEPPSVPCWLSWRMVTGSGLALQFMSLHWTALGMVTFSNFTHDWIEVYLNMATQNNEVVTNPKRTKIAINKWDATENISEQKRKKMWSWENLQ